MIELCTKFNFLIPYAMSGNVKLTSKSLWEKSAQWQADLRTAQLWESINQNQHKVLLALNVQLHPIPDTLLPSLMRLVSKDDKRAMLISKLKYLWEIVENQSQCLLKKKCMCVNMYGIYICMCVVIHKHINHT